MNPKSAQTETGNDKKSELTLKILTIGESGVGKTCILLRYTENKFKKSHLTTIGIDYKSKDITINNKPVKLKLWDTAGQERFRNMTQQYYKSTDGIVLVFDITNKSSFEMINDWMSQIKSNTEKDKLGIVLVGNKSDCDHREVSKEEGEVLASHFGMKYFETSALNNANISETFDYLAQEIVKMKNIRESNLGEEKDGDKNNPVLKIEENNPPKKKSCC